MNGPQFDMERQDLPRERNPKKAATAQGLFRKYIVNRVDGTDAPGGKHWGDKLFVLNITTDPHARVALKAYAESCGDTYPQLAADILAALNGSEA